MTNASASASALIAYGDPDDDAFRYRRCARGLRVRAGEREHADCK